MTVQNAVAIAGGFTPRGYTGKADITRTIDDKAYTAPVPISQPVQPGDTIVIRERFF
jgi:polysaccharide export outer membrane protein